MRTRRVTLLEHRKKTRRAEKYLNGFLPAERAYITKKRA
jgi:hypothetical protein